MDENEKAEILLSLFALKRFISAAPGSDEERAAADEFVRIMAESEA